MIPRSTKADLTDMFFGLLSYLEISLISIFSTKNALQYIKNFGLISLLFYKKNNGKVGQIFNHIARKLKTDRFCLKKSLMLYVLLKRAKREVAIRFGVSFVDGKPRGHCWVVLDGKSLENNDYTLIREFI